MGGGGEEGGPFQNSVELRETGMDTLRTISKRGNVGGP